MTTEIDTVKTDQQIVKLEQEHGSAIITYMAIQVVDEATQVDAANALTNVRGIIKKIDEARKELVKPLNDHVKFINSRFDQVLKPMRDAENHLNLQIRQYRIKLEEIRKKEQESLQRLAKGRMERAEAKGITPPIPEPVAPLVTGAAKTIEVDGGKVTFAKIRRWKVADLDKVPRDYFVLDEAKITKLVRSGIPEIPGIDIWEEEISVTRGS